MASIFAEAELRDLLGEKGTAPFVGWGSDHKSAESNS